MTRTVGARSPVPTQFGQRVRFETTCSDLADTSDGSLTVVRMSHEGLASPVPLRAAAHVPGSWITYGDGADLDGAHDDAVSSAWFDLGRTRSTASVIDTPLADVVIDDAPAVPFDVAVSIAQQRLIDDIDVQSFALRVATPTSYRRRRVAVRVTDPAFTFPSVPGRVEFVSSDLAAHLNSLAETSSGELLGAVELHRAVRAGYKPVVTRNQGKSVTNYGVFIAGSWGEPLSVHPSVAEARRWAVATLKAGPVADDETAVLEVRPIISRNDSYAIASVERRRVRQAAAVRLDLWEAKDQIRLAGWVIAGRGGLTNEDTKGPSEA
jgi:hypothetical protein